ncbi:unnamed protein product [Blepharisma stoltei]|uniref:Uncharacterized protein n=1 Tax=Blepharisma stoltei TaxID=1481888 RepID=A0AAU9IMM0_9CILI|nr:unnamed protein product [Blepharisma stoltei]
MQNITPQSAKIYSDDVENSTMYNKNLRKVYEFTNVNRSHIFGGPLQRDEAFLLKLKKEEQQRELQLCLKAQIEEKNRIKEQEKKSLRNFENIDTKPDQKETQEACHENLKSPIDTETSTAEQEVAKSPIPALGSEVTIENLDYLNSLCKELKNEQEKLKGKIKDQENVIQELKTTNKEKPRTASVRNRTPSKRIKISPSTSKPNKLKEQHEAEKAKIAKIEERIANARKKKAESKPKSAILKRRSSDSSEKSVIKIPETAKPISPPSQRVKSAIIKPAIPLSPVVPQTKVQVSEALDALEGKNLDNASQSYFIFPDSDGEFFNEEMEKLAVDNERRSPIEIQHTYARSCDEEKPEVPNTFLVFRKQERPLLMNKSGFPCDIFRRPK